MTYGKIHQIMNVKTAVHRQQRSALAFWWIERYREWGDDEKSLIAWQHIHADESLAARILMGIE